MKMVLWTVIAGVLFVWSGVAGQGASDVASIGTSDASSTAARVDVDRIVEHSVGAGTSGSSTRGGQLIAAGA